jgi:hypothetical protein
VWWSGAIISLRAHFSDHDFTAIAEKIYADESKREGRSLEDIVQNVGFHPRLFAITLFQLHPNRLSRPPTARMKHPDWSLSIPAPRHGRL